MDRKISPEFSRLIAKTVSSVIKGNDEEQAVKQFIRLILVIARKYVRHNVEYEDLIQHGLIGLIEAVRNFDPSRSTNFNAYAITRIKGRMYEYCINNLTSISVPTHVSKTKVYAEKMTRLLDQEPYLFNNGISPETVIRAWEHPAEEQVDPATKEAVRKIKGMVQKIANNSKTTYEDLMWLAYRSMVTEIPDDEIHDLAAASSGEKIEIVAEVNEVTEKLEKAIGKKKTAILILHHRDYNNEDIAEEIFNKKLTTRRISRQAVRGLLKAAEKKTQKNVRPG